MGIDRFQTCSVKDVGLYPSCRVILGIIFRRKTASRMLRARGPSLVLQLLEEMASPGPFLQAGAFPACGKDQLSSLTLCSKEEILESAMAYAGCGSVSCIRPWIKVCTGFFSTEFQQGVNTPCRASKPELGEGCSSRGGLGFPILSDVPGGSGAGCLTL